MNATEPAVLLVVGDLADWVGSSDAGLTAENIYFARLKEVTQEKLASVKPDIVVSRLFSKSFDALDIARQLRDLDYQGRYLAVTVPLPDQKVIVQEVNRIAPGLAFELLQLADPRDLSQI